LDRGGGLVKFFRGKRGSAAFRLTEHEVYKRPKWVEGKGCLERGEKLCFDVGLHVSMALFWTVIFVTPNHLSTEKMDSRFF
jgi:hypothetical protein